MGRANDGHLAVLGFSKAQPGVKAGIDEAAGAARILNEAGDERPLACALAQIFKSNQDL